MQSTRSPAPRPLAKKNLLMGIHKGPGPHTHPQQLLLGIVGHEPRSPYAKAAHPGNCGRSILPGRLQADHFQNLRVSLKDWMAVGGKYLPATAAKLFSGSRGLKEGCSGAAGSSVAMASFSSPKPWKPQGLSHPGDGGFHCSWAAAAISAIGHGRSPPGDPRGIRSAAALSAGRKELRSMRSLASTSWS